MLRNYLKIALRNLLKQKGFALINIFGLTAGFAAVMLILLYVNDEIGYDRYDPATANIYRIYWQSGNPQTRTPHPMAQALVTDFPEVDAAVTLSPIWGAGLTPRTFSIRNLEKDIRFDEKGVLAVDSTFFDVFPFVITKGNAKEVLRSPGKVMVSESAAKKYFGHEDPIGKHLAVDNDNNLVEIEGVFQDVPRLSHFHFDVLIGYPHMKSVSNPESEYYAWADFGHFNYIKLAPGADPKKLEAQLMNWVRKYITVPDEFFEQMLANNEGFRLQNIRDIHLTSHLRWELEANGDIEYVYIMLAAAILILFIASINFMNLTTAKSTDRAKEIGIRRTLGAMKLQLSFQFIGESVLISMFAVLTAGLVVELALPFFNQLSGKQIDSLVLNDPLNILITLGIGLLTGVIAGIYPSLVLSSFNPVNILKGRFVRTKSGSSFGRVLVVFQFTMAICLISATTIIYNQLSFIQNKDLGFAKEAVMVVPIRDRAVARGLPTLKTELEKIPGIESVSASSNTPGMQFNQNPLYIENDPQNRVDASQMYVAYNLDETLGMELLAGRFFSREFPSDTVDAFVINEIAAKNLLLDNPVGTEIILDSDGRQVKGTVIGVLKDFHYQSLHEPIRPILLQLQPYLNSLFVKIDGQDFRETLKSVQATYEKFQPTFDFEYSFLDETLEAQYTAESKMGTIFSLFAGLAIVISCLGLFGLASLNYAQRKKEVGIRKVLGAPVFDLLINLVKGYSRLILMATFAAVPIAWFTMNDWLNHFVYKTSINIGVFVLTGLATMIIAWLTIGYLTMRTASANPVDALKEE